ncbi:hypothetical protein I4641_13025 [Waterburya agarophytonicola K14]|uniref:Secreted protein n=1 Tax=Waterburya agarophytonicola KI4 TaxID=2874699 RepID=A0A964BTD1_9CYAN|nr:hypothetical protein [Waterburya agarophytonicola]MCC0177901.1 hypothetical protein [Waterburya agarophytonicola KI4]
MNLIKKNWIYCLCLAFFCLWGISPVNAGVLSNKDLTVSVGNQQSWTGRNGTGNLSYYGCDRQCQCIYLTGGKITCRNGVCQTVWQNKDYSYVLSSPITNPRTYPETPTTLTIYSESGVISEAELYPKPFDNLDSRN